jgi:hypothetical protein
VKRFRLRGWLVLFIVLVAARICVVPIALSEHATQPRRTLLPGDVHRYHRIALSHGVPYQDFEVEYPPVMLGAIELLDASSVRTATVELMWSQAFVDIAIAVIVLWGWGKRASLAYLLIGLPFLLYPFIYLRLDLLSVALAMLALAMVRRGRMRTGGALLAFSCFAKIWPVLLGPTFIVRRSMRGLVAFAATGLVGLGAWVAWATTAGPTQVLTLRGATGWEIESSVGSVLHTLQGGIVHIQEGAPRIGDAPAWATVAMAIGIAGATAAIWWLVSRIRPVSTAMLDGIAPLAVLVVFLLLSPIISPQYMCWLVPFAAIACLDGDYVIGVAMAAIVGLSTLGFALLIRLMHSDVAAIAIVDVRNVLLLALGAYLVVRLVRAARARPEPEPKVVQLPEERVPVGALVDDLDEGPLSTPV